MIFSRTTLSRSVRLFAIFMTAAPLLISGCTSKPAPKTSNSTPAGTPVPGSPSAETDGGKKPGAEQGKNEDNHGKKPPAKKAEPILVKSDYKKGDVAAACKKAIDVTKEKLKAIAAIPADKRTFDNTVLALETATGDFADLYLPLTFMGYVHTDKDVRAEGSACEDATGGYVVEINTNKALYNAIKDQKPRNDDEKRLLSETLKVFEYNGIKASDEVLAKVQKLKTDEATAMATFTANLNNDATMVELTPEELAGVPESYVSSLKKTEDGKRYILSTRESDYGIVPINATNPEGRKKFLLGYNNRQAEANTKILEDTIGLRQQIAKLLGFENWAGYRSSYGKMANSQKIITDFLSGLQGKLAQRNQEEIATLLKLKQEFDPQATQVDAWDISYLTYQYKKKQYSLDDEKIREYFPSEQVVAGLFELYSNLLGVKFTEVKDAEVWSKEVKLYKIENAPDSRLIGYFYTDFIPRPKKYGHAAAFPLIQGRMTANGYSYPVSAIVANFNKPTEGKPSLLSHSDVVTMFHEFGHIMHQTLTRAPYISLSGANVAMDFVEAPSQMLENWPWQPEVLNKISGHYQDSSKKLPTELLNKMIGARDFGQAMYFTRQIWLGTTDIAYHTATGAVNSVEVMDQAYEKIVGIKPIEGNHFAASFGHIMGGYDVGYYGYLWSLVYAADMFTRFSTDGIQSAVAGSDYRLFILEKGSMQDPLDLLRQFIKRDTNDEAFLEKLHIQH